MENNMEAAIMGLYGYSWDTGNKMEAMINMNFKMVSASTLSPLMFFMKL